MRVAVAFVTALVVASPASAETIRGGTVEPGKGVAGVYLGMTRAEVKEAKGTPREEGDLYMSYGPKRTVYTSFDVYLENVTSKPVRMIGFWGSGFVLDDGTKLFGDKVKPVPKLKRRFGDRLRKVENRRTGDRLYRVKSRYRGKRVWTDFMVDRFGRDARVLSAFILFPYR